eukprot:TRINITY_DN658_c0_g1_i3.p6 TRINITY_DN658_c0_g1~~TRINITY_DN658_c0_g1_i3.p6  ORF type:complete len:125 (-),score=9.02 TRINITY_DN658_c0_g1_i3:101-475(-)
MELLEICRSICFFKGENFRDTDTDRQQWQQGIERRRYVWFLKTNDCFSCMCSLFLVLYILYDFVRVLKKGCDLGMVMWELSGLFSSKICSLYCDCDTIVFLVVDDLILWMEFIEYVYLFSGRGQ